MQSFITQKVCKPINKREEGEFLATWSETCQGHDPDTAVSPFTILLYPLTWGLIEGTPHPCYKVHSAKMASLSQYAQFTAHFSTSGKRIPHINALTQHRCHKGKTTGKQEHGDRDSIPPRVPVVLRYSLFIGGTQTNLTVNCGHNSGKGTPGDKHLWGLRL